jgi:two-component system sensor histidine kinase/response regulator
MSRQPIARLLVVDDEAAQMKALCDTLSLEDYATVGFSNGLRALQALREEEFDLLLTDLMMPEMDGIELIGRARDIAPDLVVVMMTGHATIDTAVKAMQAGALDYIVKPFKLNVILPVLNRAVAVRRLRVENALLERQVAERTRELEVANRQLESANKELEAFSYSVSHDLRAPLRAVQGFVQIYMEDFGASIPEEGMPVLEHVVQGSQRMGQLIEDLLEFSRLGRQPILRQIVPLDRMVKRLVGDMKGREPGRQVELKVAALGECEGDPSLIEQVLVNLISNAFKFTRKRDVARIEIACEKVGDELIYRVSDNGAGFDMKYAAKLFGVFQRLHTVSEFEGTGVGLSIVKRIIERHGGRIWAQSEVDKGTTFFFTLPAEPPEAPSTSVTGRVRALQV